MGSHSPLRVVSLLPSATDMICCIGGAHLMVGRSHECDWPHEITDRPVLTAAVTKFESSRQMHDAVNQSLAQGKGLYTLDAELLAELKPDVVLTQSLCEVCSVDLCVVERVAANLQPRPKVLSFNPFNLDQVMADIADVGEAVCMQEQAAEKIAELKGRVAKVQEFVREVQQADAARPKVAFLEWTDPFFVGGHWTPEVIRLAGGSHPLNEAVEGQGAGKSIAVEDSEVEHMDPDYVIICPCGFDIPTTKREMCTLEAKPWWRKMVASRPNRVFLVDGCQMFNRPGPRLVDALEFVAGILHDRYDIIPKDFPWERYVLPPQQQ